MNDAAAMHPLQATVEAFIKATNAHDIEAALALFTPAAVIDDPSTGRTFNHRAGVRDYLKRYFVAYRTVTRLLSADVLGDGRVRARVDFTGDFGHEIGLLDMAVDSQGRISRIDAELEQAGEEATMNTLMIYGATGYTGRMAAARAKEAGLTLVVAGRDQASLQALAATLGVEYRLFALDVPADVERELQDITVLLNCAGPFVHTAGPLVAACLRTHTHYLDIAAELDSYQLAAHYDREAVDAGVMLMPGSGGSVAMLGSLAARALEQVAAPSSLRIALHVSGAMSRGSAVSANQHLAARCLMRKGDLLTPRAPDELRDFDFGKGVVSCFPVTLPDLITIAHQTGIGDIETYVHVSGNAFAESGIDALPDGPTAQERVDNRYQAAVEVMDADGAVTHAVLDTVNGYSFTPLAAIEAARRVLEGDVRPGFQTPVGVFGSGFAETIADTRITSMPSTNATTH